MPMTPNAPTRRTPHNKSDRARDAEARGEHTWTGWRLAELIDQVLRVNRRGLTAKNLRDVRSLEYLKVKLLVPTQRHHTGLRMPQPVTLKQDQYFAVNTTLAEKLTPREVSTWRDFPMAPEELDEAVENLTGRKYYREAKH